MYTSPSKPTHQRIHSTRLSASPLMLFRLDFKRRCGHELKRALNPLSPIAERVNSPQRQMHARFNQPKIGGRQPAQTPPMRTRYLSHKPDLTRDAASPTTPGPYTWPQWPPWRGATRPRSRRTSRSSASGPRRSRCRPASSRARAAASCCRWRSGGRGRGGRRPS